MSTHSVQIIRIKEIKLHPNADNLAVVKISEEYQVVVQIGSFNVGDFAVYIEPDYMVPTSHPEFSFLKKKDNNLYHRLKAIRLRGQISHGLLIPVPNGLITPPIEEGRNVMDELGITRYEPENRLINNGDRSVVESYENWPNFTTRKFDLESALRMRGSFTNGMAVVVSEKIHGTNARFVYDDAEDRFYVGSRNIWLKPDSRTVYHMAVEKYPEIESWCRDNPGLVLYGEIYGPEVQRMGYGLSIGEIDFRAFAVHNPRHGTWMDWGEFTETVTGAGVPRVTVLYFGPYDFDIIRSLAEDDSVVALANGVKDYLMEGVVVVPQTEILTQKGERVAMKFISDRYLLSNY